VSSPDECASLSILREKKDREEWETSFKALAQPFFQVGLRPAAPRGYRVPKAPICWWSRPRPDMSAELRVFPGERKEICPFIFESRHCPGVVETWLVWSPALLLHRAGFLDIFHVLIQIPLGNWLGFFFWRRSPMGFSLGSSDPFGGKLSPRPSSSLEPSLLFFALRPREAPWATWVTRGDP